jgi:hypothetical protein
LIVRDKELPHQSRRAEAGMIFLNDEGTENGGLIFDGAKTAGRTHSTGHLSFDQYEQDQVVNLEQVEDSGNRYARLGISDRPDASLDFVGISHLESMPEGSAKEAEMKRRAAAGEFGQPRLFVGKQRMTQSWSRAMQKDANASPSKLLRRAPLQFNSSTRKAVLFAR